MLRYLTALAVLMLIATAVLRSARHGGVATFKVSHEKSADGIPLLTPILPTKVGYETLSGKPPQAGEVLNCTPMTKAVLENRQWGQITALTLQCGNSLLLVKGIEFTTEAQ